MREFSNPATVKEGMFEGQTKTNSCINGLLIVTCEFGSNPQFKPVESILHRQNEKDFFLVGPGPPNKRSFIRVTHNLSSFV